ncbi:MAG: ROK family protein [Candidatus Pacebacteria bacterium]|nr:ROK family protein [Candidatus Paceibacterota bacterium]
MTTNQTIDYAANGPLPLLRIIDRQGPQSQRGLARKLGLTFAGVSFHLKKMHSDRMVRKFSKPATQKRGRPSITWDMDRVKNCTLGIVIAPPEMEMSMCDFADNVILQETQRLGRKTSLENIVAAMDRFIAASIEQAGKNRSKIRQVFVGVPGHLDAETGRIIDCPNLPALDGMDFEEHIQTRFGLKTMVQAANYAVYAGEIDRFGRDTVGMLITWELGLGVLFGCNEDIYNFLGQSGEKYRGLWDIGHMRIAKGGKVCKCGKRGCLEAYAGGWAMLEQTKKKLDSLDEFIALAKNGNSAVLKIFRVSAKLLGKQLAGLVELMGIEKIVIAGPLAEIFDLARDDFNAGLCNLLDANDVSALSATASTDSQVRAAIGAGRIAKFAFLYPEALLERRKNMARSYRDNSRPS